MHLSDLEATIARLSDDDRGALETLVSGELGRPWRPNPGPQTAALESEADLLLYGGAAGGGKSSLLLGCAVRNHRRALILRRKSVELDGLIAESQAMLAGRGSFNKVERHWVFGNGELGNGASLKFGGMKDADDWRDYAGRARDYIGFDEAAEFLEEQIASLIGWLRSTDAGQRCRVVLASNPPRGGDGAWIVTWFAPWLDPLYPEPAEPGELRWAINAGDRLIWRKGPGAVEIDGETYTARSRTFIPARLDDNPYLSETSYRAGLQSLPEPLRSQLLNGDFSAGREDDAWQVIPSAWVAAANRRWETAVERHRRMIALSADIAMGGRDDTVLAALYEDAWYAPVTARRGFDTKNGRAIAALMAAERLNNADLSVDLTGGWGAAACEALQGDLGLACAGLVASAGSSARTADGRFGFLNQRAQWWWRFREALDPATGDDVKLPPDQRLAAELATPRWRLKGTQVQIEDKDEIRKRLGTSTDRADAVIQAWSRREAALQADSARTIPAGGWGTAEDDESVLVW